ncbi:hypothetical protein DVH05_021667 [Phytophthora capsici]|nr:hypothetical protein DVH05_021667 [Phytophthora capsici]
MMVRYVLKWRRSRRTKEEQAGAVTLVEPPATMVCGGVAVSSVVGRLDSSTTSVQGQRKCLRSTAVARSAGSSGSTGAKIVGQLAGVVEELEPTEQPSRAMEKHVAGPMKTKQTISAAKSDQLLTVFDAKRVLASIFSDVTANDIRQKAGMTQNNAGELLPAGVAQMLEAMEPLDERDIFLDVGSGIGNVLVQVALTTKVNKCIGVEVRDELCAIATHRISRNIKTYPLLQKVTVKAADVRDVLLATQPPTSDATIVFANYFLFEEDAKLTSLAQCLMLASVLRRLSFVQDTEQVAHANFAQGGSFRRS